MTLEARPGTGTEAPPRGTRPRNRRDLIRDAAASLFAEHGYGQVSLSDVAAAVNVGPSALYRHYSGKAELLYDVVDSALDVTVVDQADLEHAELSEVVATMARNILDNRLSGLLFQRESRNLSTVERATLRKKVSLVQRWLAARLHEDRPSLDPGQAELLAACGIDAMTSISFHRLSIARPAFEELIAGMCLRVLALEPGPSTTASGRPRRSRPSTRADELIDASIRLFARDGYSAVSIDDIGAAVGIAGPSVYRHFESKQDLLVAAMNRGAERIRSDFANAVAEGTSDEDRLRRVTDAYVSTGLTDSEEIAILIGEGIHVEEPMRREMRAVQRALIDDWVALLRACRPADSETVARVKVQAAQMVANDVGRTPHLRKVPGFRQTVFDACWAVQQ